MSLARFWTSVKLLHFSKPAGDRALYRAVRGRSIGSVLEVNVGNGSRSRTLVQWLRDLGNEGTIRYAAVDTFEMGGDDHIALKNYHSMLGKLGAKPLPVPNTGQLGVALKRVAHTIGAVDLMVLDCSPADYTEATVASWLPRLVTSDSLVMARCAEAEGLWPLNVQNWHQPAAEAA